MKCLGLETLFTTKLRQIVVIDMHYTIELTRRGHSQYLMILPEVFQYEFHKLEFRQLANVQYT